MIVASKLDEECFLTELRSKVPPPSIPPAHLRLRTCGSTDEREFLGTGWTAKMCIEECLTREGLTMQDCPSILDFACGCGRILHWFTGTPGAVFSAIDVDREAVKWCLEHISNVAFSICSSLPPLPYPDAHFDLIYGVSILTHIDEWHQKQWLQEFARVAKPGSLLILTTLSDLDAARFLPGEEEVYRKKGFIYRPVEVEGLPPSYGITCQSEEYIAAQWTSSFALVHYAPRAIDGLQDIVVMRRH